jgi:hypothetical protein
MSQSHRIVPRILLPVVLLTLALVPGRASAQSTETATTTTTGNWTYASIWNCTPALSPCVPNNGTPADDTYDVAINGGKILLNQYSTVKTVTVDSLSVSSSSPIPASLDIDTSESLTVTGNANIGARGELGLGELYSAGSLTVGGNLTNTGSISAYADVGNTLTVDGTFDNAGGVVKITGGPYSSAPMQTTVAVETAAPAILTGTWDLYGGGDSYEPGGAAVLNYAGGGAITQIGDGGTNPGDVFLGGPGAFIEADGVSGNSALTKLATIASNGSLSIGETLTTTASHFVNSGSVEVDGTLKATGSYTQAAGSTDVYGTLIAPGGVTVNGGSLSGTGTIESNVANSAVVSPVYYGFPCTLSIDGDYTQTSKGTLTIDLGTIPYSLLKVTGDSSLDGTVNFNFLDGYNPKPGATFDFLDSAGGAFGTFTNVEINGVSCPRCLHFVSVGSNGAEFVWSRAPEPGSLLLLAMGLIAVLYFGSVWRAKQALGR